MGRSRESSRPRNMEWCNPGPAHTRHPRREPAPHPNRIRAGLGRRPHRRRHWASSLPIRANPRRLTLRWTKELTTSFVSYTARVAGRVRRSGRKTFQLQGFPRQVSYGLPHSPASRSRRTLHPRSPPRCSRHEQPHPHSSSRVRRELVCFAPITRLDSRRASAT